MISHRYTAIDGAGHRKSGFEVAVDRNAVVDQLMRRGLTPLSVRPTTLWIAPWGLGRGSALSRRDALLLLRDLANLANGAVPVERALALVVATAPSSRVANLVEDIHRKVRRGESLSMAVSVPGLGLPRETAAIIAAGEASGTLADALSRLVDMEERRAVRRERLVSALAYPVLVLIVASVALAVMTGYVLPKFEDTFIEAGQKLPPLTSFVLTFGRLVAATWPWLLAAIGMVGLAIRLLLRRAAVKSARDIFILRAGPIGKIIRDGEIAAIVRTLATLLRGGVALAPALDLTQSASANLHIRRAIANMSADVRRGGRLSEAMGAQRLFPLRVVRLVALAEEGGRVAAALLEIAEILEKDHEMAIRRILAILPQLLTLLLGGIVGTIVVAMVSGVVAINDLAE